MAYKQRQAAPDRGRASLVLLMSRLQSPEIAASLDKLYAKYGKYAMSADQVRKMLDKEMGERTLTEELYAMREGR